MKVYAVKCEDNFRKRSSSGGFFSQIVSEFDVVYGVAMSEDCYSANMIRSEKDVSLMMGSKYIQAKIGDCLKSIKEDLDAGKKVLFSGTGCQVNGLKCFLQHEYNNLLCLDVVCHGVPSPALWKKYQEDKYGKINTVNFRCKDKGWKEFGIKHNSLFISKNKDFYMQMFLKNYSLRPSCYDCHAKKMKLADITIADFWGVENVVPEMDDDMGTSLVIVRTQKGEQEFFKICNKFMWKEVEYKDGVKSNSAEYISVEKPLQRDNFFEDMNSMPFNKLMKKYNTNSIVFRIKSKIQKIFINKKEGGF